MDKTKIQRCKKDINTNYGGQIINWNVPRLTKLYTSETLDKGFFMMKRLIFELKKILKFGNKINLN